MDSSAVVPQLMKTPRLRKILPTTLRPEAIPDKRKRPETQDSHPFLKNVQECPRNICGLPRGFHRNRRLPVPEKKPMRTVHPDKIYREIIWFCSSYLLKSGPEATRTIINSVFSEWASINNDYPSPFSWVDSRDSEQCDWLWNAMQVRCVGTPLNPLTPEQKYWFACATFDNWEGWNEQQVQFYWKVIPDGTEQKFTQVSFNPRFSIKRFFLMS